MGKLGELWDTQTLKEKLMWLVVFHIIAFMSFLVGLNKIANLPTTNNGDITGWYSLLIGSTIGIYITFAILIYSNTSQKKTDELIERVHVFTEEQNKIKDAKRKRYARGILARLELIDFEVEGLFIFTAFLKKATSEPEKKEKEDTILKKYERTQWLFMNMKIEYDTMLEVFDQKLEEKYVKVSGVVISHKDIWRYNFDKISTLESAIEEIRNEFKIFKDLIIQFISSESRSRYEKLFNLEEYKKQISKI